MAVLKFEGQFLDTYVNIKCAKVHNFLYTGFVSEFVKEKFVNI